MTPRATRPALARARAAGLSDARRAAPATSAEAVDRMPISTSPPASQTSTPTRRTRQRAKADPSLNRAGAQGGTPPVTSCFVMRGQVMPYWMHTREGSDLAARVDPDGRLSLGQRSGAISSEFHQRAE